MSSAKAIDVDAVIEAANRLDPLPSSITALVEAVNAEHIEVDEVVAIVSLDQALAGAVLRAANSAFSASLNPVGTVRDAVIRVGSLTVLALGVGQSVRGMARQAVPAYGLAAGDLWRHALASSLAADALRKLAPSRRVFASASTAALLHDIGKPILGQMIDDGSMARVREARAGGLGLPDAERLVLGIHHGEVGGIVAETWRLPPELVSAIVNHHTPDLDGPGLADMVHVADWVGEAVAGGCGDRDSPASAVLGPSLDRVGLTPDEVERAREITEGKLEETLNRL